MNNHSHHEPSRQRPPHQESKMLTKSENQDLHNILGQNRVTLATAVVQILLPEQPHQTRWLKHACGVFCFVKDYDQRTYCFRLYDLKQRRHIYEEIVAASLHLEKKLPFFFWFDGSNSKVGINFANEDEAGLFFQHFQSKQQDRQKKKKHPAPTKSPPPSQIHQQQHPYIAPQPSPFPTPSTNIITGPKVSNNQPSINATLSKKQQSTKSFFSTLSRRNKYVRPDISEPVMSSFAHVGHVGINANDSFFHNEEQAQLFETFIHGIEKSMPGITAEEKKAIKEYIDAKGGIEQLTKLQPSIRDLNTQSNTTGRQPNRQNQQSGAPDIPPRIQTVRNESSSSADARHARLPLSDMFNPPQQAAPDIPPRPGRQPVATSASPQKHHIAPNIPPPPPPPPPPPFFHTNVGTTQSNHDVSSSMNNGASFDKKKLQRAAEQQAAQAAASSTDKRSNLHPTSTASSVDAGGPDALTNGILQLLAERRKQIMPAEEDEAESEDEDWT
ncbi:unnamed protein product [Didymodactylos carnosus]|uniref:Wiskott-Aldrich syndrome protein n=1 Tax=Didymodactylos carnosus TaxID=1234261 RepID=A0A813TR68_9BILA|nr:unnamed protein product [Didymodactylos carnosus]CAF3603072.1 unnamed protein product [Didymodactylos carnosus]